MHNTSQSLPRQAAPQTLNYHAATVRSVSGATCDIDIAGTLHSAEVAPHILSLERGQRVAVLDGGPDAGYLVIAAWPINNQVVEAPLKFETATGTLHIHAATLNLSALATIELRCGEARIRLTLDGKAQIEGTEVLSAAIGPNRIEGASIDLN